MAYVYMLFADVQHDPLEVPLYRRVLAVAATLITTQTVSPANIRRGRGRGWRIVYVGITPKYGYLFFFMRTKTFFVVHDDGVA